MRPRLLTSVLLLPAFLVSSLLFSADPRPELPPAQRVTFDGNTEVGAALKLLHEKTRIPVEDRRGEPDTKIDLHLKEVTFWEALDRIAAAAGAEVDLYAADGKLALRKRTGRPPLTGPQTVSYDGRFRTAIKRITGSVDLETGERSYVGVVEVAWEPGTQPYFLNTRVDALTLDGRKAAGSGGKNQFVYRQNADQFETALPTPPPDAKTIGELTGKVSVVAPSRIATFAFGPLDQIKGMPKQEDGKVVCRIEDVKLSGNNWKVKVSMSYPPGNAELDDTHSAYQIAATNELVLESKDGKRRFVALPSYVPAATPTSVVVEYNLTKDNRPTGEAKDWTVSFRAPAAVVRVPVAFTFKDVPLP